MPIKVTVSPALKQTREEQKASSLQPPNGVQLSWMAMAEEEQRAEYEEYLRRCEGIPISIVKP